MYCLSNMCYVCLQQKDKSLIDINTSLSVNADILHILGYLPCNLVWMQTKQIILICEECCRRLRETYQFLVMCFKNSAVMQGYMAKLNKPSISDTDNEAELRVDIINDQHDINKIKCEIKSEDDEIYTFESGQIIEATEDVFVNVAESFIKEEDTWKREAEDVEEEPPMDNNPTESSEKVTDSELAVNRNTHDTDTDTDSSEATSTQGHTTNKKELNTPAKKSHKCLTCSKSFSSKSILQRHTDKKPCKCAICEKCFSIKYLVQHMRVHSGEKPFKCTVCKKCFNDHSNLVRHMRIHTGERPHECSVCKKRFTHRIALVTHMRIHTGEKPHQCARCTKCFSDKSALRFHMRTHSGEKPHKCYICKKVLLRSNI